MRTLLVTRVWRCTQQQHRKSNYRLTSLTIYFKRVYLLPPPPPPPPPPLPPSSSSSIHHEKSCVVCSVSLLSIRYDLPWHILCGNNNNTCNYHNIVCILYVYNISFSWVDENGEDKLAGSCGVLPSPFSPFFPRLNRSITDHFSLVLLLWNIYLGFPPTFLGSEKVFFYYCQLCFC